MIVDERGGGISCHPALFCFSELIPYVVVGAYSPVFGAESTAAIAVLVACGKKVLACRLCIVVSIGAAAFDVAFEAKFIQFLLYEIVEAGFLGGEQAVGHLFGSPLRVFARLAIVVEVVHVGVKGQP